MVNWVKGQGHHLERSNVYISEVLGPIWMKIGEYMEVNPTIGYMSQTGLKVKVIKVKGQMNIAPKVQWSNVYNSKVLGPIWMKLGEYMQVNHGIRCTW